MRFTDNQSLDTASMANLDILAGTDVSSGTDKKFTLANLASWFLGQFNGLSLAGNNQTVQAAIDEMSETKADADGVYDNLAAGTSKQLLSDSYTENFEPYKFRRSPYTDRMSESIVGCSVAWNQLVNTSDTSVTVPNGHKYLSRISGTDALGESTGTAISVAGTDNVHDLTAMFGTAVADTLYNMGNDGIKLFRSWYPSTYYPYTEATMEHVSGLEAHEMVGFNTFDIGASVLGESVSTSTGAITTRENAWRSGYTRCFPDTEYFASGLTNTLQNLIAFYDADKNYLGRTSGAITAYRRFTTPQGCAYFIITQYTSGTLTFTDGRDTVCVNISDETMNGTYKPYESHSYALDESLTLRGLIKYDTTKGFYADGDVYKADGTVTRRYGVVDLGTLTWSYNSDRQFFTTDTVPNRMSGSLNLLTAKYTTGTQTGQANISDKMITSGTNVTSVVIRDLAYTSAASFKTAMSGVYLVYELATPTTESAEPYDAIQITDGTEEYVTDCLVPVGHESKYYANLRSKIEGLPTDFSAIICATEATNRASRNYAVGDYLIYNNTLYKVTTAIATDATLTVGTNITATTIMAEIKALQ